LKFNSRIFGVVTTHYDSHMSKKMKGAKQLWH